VTDHPEFNLYADRAAIDRCGWDMLRAMMERHAPTLRTLPFPRANWLSAQVEEGLLNPDQSIPTIRVPLESGTLVLMPVTDTEGYKSVFFQWEV
jgi:hypothetical protein